MTDSSVQKINAQSAPAGEMGQKYLACGARIGMRLWQEDEYTEPKPTAARNYETIGYVIDGRAKLDIEGQTLILEPGDSWVVPKGAEHTYTISQPFTAIETTCPPAHEDGRDGQSTGG